MFVIVVIYIDTMADLVLKPVKEGFKPDDMHMYSALGYWQGLELLHKAINIRVQI